MNTLAYQNREYALEATKGLPSHITVLGTMSIADLAMMHNLCISEAKLNANPVTKFADKATAVKRTWAILQQFHEKKFPKPAAAPKIIIKAAPKVAGEKHERKKRGQRFVFPLGDEIKSVRPETNRAKLIELLLRPEGATFEECMAATWGKNKDMTPEIQHKTTYEGIRLLHYYVGYGMKHDMETGIIRIYK